MYKNSTILKKIDRLKIDMKQLVIESLQRIINYKPQEKKCSAMIDFLF